MDLNLSLTPRLSIEKLQLENAPWAEPSPMASMQALELSVNLPELLTGTIVVEQIAMLEPSVTLMVSEPGEKTGHSIPTALQNKQIPQQATLSRPLPWSDK